MAYRNEEFSMTTQLHRRRGRTLRRSVTWLAATLLLATGCGDSSSERDGSSGSIDAIDALSVELTWSDDGTNPTDTDGDGVYDTGCGDRLDVSVFDPQGRTQWEFGFAHTGVYHGWTSGWTGEDCFVGYSGYPGDFHFCHPFSGTALTLMEVRDCSAFSIVEGQTTLFDAGFDPTLTYYLGEIGGGGCYTWGDDPSYFDALGCKLL